MKLPTPASTAAWKGGIVAPLFGMTSTDGVVSIAGELGCQGENATGVGRGEGRIWILHFADRLAAALASGEAQAVRVEGGPEPRGGLSCGGPPCGRLGVRGGTSCCGGLSCGLSSGGVFHFAIPRPDSPTRTRRASAGVFRGETFPNLLPAAAALVVGEAEKAPRRELGPS